MKSLNAFYLAVLVGAGSLFWLLRSPPNDDFAIYGIAESSETEINYNYPVAVEEILVRPGQPVDSGAVLLRLVRRTAKNDIADENYRIDELRAEEAAWRSQRRQRLELENAEYNSQRDHLLQEIAALEKEIDFRTTLPELSSVDLPEGDYQPLRARLQVLRSDLDGLDREHTAKRDALMAELAYGAGPYQQRIRRLKAEADFDAGRETQHVTLKAPADGLIGSVSCREGEFKGAYERLITFYEPHSDLVKGYLQEQFDVSVNLGDQFEAISLTSEDLRYPATVTGLGSRIVEIPERLRRYPTVKSYGREITVRITAENGFLQREKVGLRYIGEAVSK